MTKIIDKNKVYLAYQQKRNNLVKIRKLMDELVTQSIIELEQLKEEDNLVETQNKYIYYYNTNNIWLSS